MAEDLKPTDGNFKAKPKLYDQEREDSTYDSPKAISRRNFLLGSAVGAVAAIASRAAGDTLANLYKENEAQEKAEKLTPETKAAIDSLAQQVIDAAYYESTASGKSEKEVQEYYFSVLDQFKRNLEAKIKNPTFPAQEELIEEPEIEIGPNPGAVPMPELKQKNQNESNFY